MADISEELLKKIWDTFEKELANNNKMKAILKKVEDGSATYIEANDYSYYAGDAIAKAIKKNISEDDLPDGIMSKDIAEKILRPMFSKDYDLVSDVCLQVQEALNESAGIGIKAIKPSFPNDRMMGIADYVSQKKYSEREKSLSDNVVNAIQSISEDSVKKNAEFQYRSGLTPMIVRTLKGKACDFCEKRAGKYEYPLKDNEIYRRHPNCRCTVEFVPAGSKKRQNVHTKHWEEKAKVDDNDIDYIEELNKKKNIQKAKGENCFDVTNYWYTNTNSEKREIKNAKYVYVNGKKVEVNGSDAKIKHNEREIEIANVLVDNFGGEITLLPEVYNPKYIEMADYLYRGEKYDLKTPEKDGKHALYNMIHKKEKQAHNFIFCLDVTPLSTNEIVKQVKEDIFKSTHTGFVDRIILIKNNAIINIFERI